ncbi:MAG: hypothetical protein PHI34_09980 [Acidobacteriota bacterium]|nr:hypothetical protein [Acidobacteriota bacterium]
MRRAAFWLLVPLLLAAGEPPLARIQGLSLAYSHDLNQIIGQNVSLDWLGWTVTAETVKIDVASRAGAAMGRVVLHKGEARLEADEFLFDLAKEAGILVRYGDDLETSPFPPARAIADAGAEARTRRAVLESVTWAKMRASLFYASARAMDILPTFEVYGDDVLVYVEGLEAVGFKRLKLSLGDKPRTNGLTLDKIWYSRNQGLFGDASLILGRDKKLHSRTQLHYEEHTVLSDYSGLPRQYDLETSTVWSASPKLDLGWEGNYSSTSLGNARIFALTKSRDAKRSVLFDLTYQKPLQSADETWLGVQTDLKSEAWGNLTFHGRQELHDQTLADLSYAKAFGKSVRFGLNARYSHLRLGGRGATTSRILTGNVQLAYESDGYQAAAEYHLNDDLLGDRRLTQPRFRLAVKPFAFYGGLLTASLSNSLVFQTLNDAGKVTPSYNDNTVFSLAAAPVTVRPGLTFRTSFTAEQFTEKEKRNFTSGGLVLNVVQEFVPGVTLEVFYSAQSRRRTKGWLIEGTTSQDLTAAFRVRTGGRIDGWMTISYDPKHADWKRGMADLAVGLIKDWRVQTLLNYDFYTKKMASVDLSLIRRAGRFDVKFLWRSLSKQFLIELVPAM